jgi:uncharacterized protein DUF4153
MRFPSIETAAREARATLVRFPLSILSGLTGMLMVIRMVDSHNQDWQPRLLATSVMGLALFTASVTTAERRGIASGTRWAVNLAILLALALIFRASLGWTDRMASLRFVQLVLIAHLLVAVGPYAGGRGDAGRRLEGFWQYNRFLFLRYLVAAFYAAVLWIGLSVALAAIDKLFGVSVRGETYARLWAVMALGFHPWFFLAGVPRDFAGLDTLDDYPVGLKVFTQFVLMPLVAVYLAILTAYLGKIIITRTWPSGWIGYLVSSISLAGVLALLLVHPIRERADSRWVNWYGRWWFVAILPSLVMLVMAVGQRLGQYGVTEPRYFLLVLALWMVGLSLYYGVTASRNIKLIPISLAAVSLLTTVGPWGAYAVSERSQVARFDRILEANHMGRTGVAGRAPAAVSFKDRRELSATLRYLDDTRGAAAVAAVLSLPPDTIAAWKKDTNRWNGNDLIAGHAMDHLGLAYVNRWEQAAREEQSFWATQAQTRALEVSGFQVARTFAWPGPMEWIGTDADSLQLVKVDSSGAVVAKHGGEPVVTLDLKSAVRGAIPADSLRFGGGAKLPRAIVVEGTGGGFRLRVVFESINGVIKSNGIELRSGTGFVLVAGLGGAPADSARTRADPPKR